MQLSTARLSLAIVFTRRASSALKLALLALIMTLSTPVFADIRTVIPTGLFLQLGSGEKETETYVAGALWDWNWQRQYSYARISGYSEVSFGRWISTLNDQTRSAWVTQVGITPALRIHGVNSWSPWFVEVGIGANLILPIYRNQEKSFSTTFNFGDHLGIGRQWGEHREHELALRTQHFSNAGIDHPNPGENFLQLRYTRRFSKT